MLAEQQQDRRDQRAGVANSNPENEVGNIERPADAVVESPDPDAVRDEPGNHRSQVQHRGTGDSQANPPAPSRFSLQRPGNIISDLIERGVSVYPSRRRKDLRLVDSG